jgi:uncharacterized protein (TIGR00296 family)
MLSLEEGKKAVSLARTVVECYVLSKEIPQMDLEGVFKQEQGVFTTLHTYPDYNLRGCIGFPLPVMPLKEAIIESAKSATNDPRFPKLNEKEIDKIIIEVTILTQPELINVSQSKDYVNHIEIGRDGLIVEQGFYKGLLLPQVPVEQNWEKEEFLSHTCMKAGLLPDAWLDKNSKIYKFTGQIFTEIEPKGNITEKNLDGSGN